MITQDQARGDSIGVTEDEYDAHARAGRDALTRYLFVPDPFVCDIAWQSVQDSWGGVTVKMPYQRVYEADNGYALKACGGPFPWVTLSIPISSLSRERFDAMYAEAIKRFAGAPFIGIFRDEDTGLVEFDAVIVVESEQDARDIATYCEAIGGAYDFSTGNGVFPYHVVSTSKTMLDREDRERRQDAQLAESEFSR